MTTRFTSTITNYQKAKNENYDVVLIDTAGRLHNKKYLMDELYKIQKVIDKELPDAENLKVKKAIVSNPKLSLSATKTQSGDAVTITASEAYEGALQVMAKAENDYKIFATCEVYFPLEA